MSTGGSFGTTRVSSGQSFMPQSSASKPPSNNNTKIVHTQKPSLDGKTGSGKTPVISSDEMRKKLVEKNSEVVVERVKKMFGDELDYVNKVSKETGKFPEGTTGVGLDLKKCDWSKSDKTIVIPLRTKLLLETNVVKLKENELKDKAQTAFYNAVMLAVMDKLHKKHAMTLLEFNLCEPGTMEKLDTSKILQSKILEVNATTPPQFLKYFG